jgi:nitroimidazol reductase NimA-like FMN-containing flavoprotein (pyridoxamine 5'-phosphate oxidase superfamily)
MTMDSKRQEEQAEWCVKDGALDESDLSSIIKDLLAGQKLAVLATQRHGEPYGNLVAFAATEDLCELMFVTPRNSRKFANIAESPNVALVMDSRSNDSDDFSTAVAITALGHAVECDEAQKKVFTETYLKKHPHLVDFAESETNACMVVQIDTYIVVRRFQEIAVLARAL